MKPFLHPAILYFAFFLVACGPPDDKLNLDSSEWELEIVDSIQVKTLESLDLLDINPERGLFLFNVQKENSPMILIDKNGEILHRLDVPKDAPTGFGGICSGAIFAGDSILIQGRRGVYSYDLEFNFLSHLKRPYPPKGMMYAGFDHIRTANTYEGTALISFSGNPQTDYPPNQRAYYENFNGLDLIPISSLSFKPIAPLHPESRYLSSGMAFNFISLTFSVSNSQLTYAHPSDSLLYDMDLMDPTLKQTPTKIPFDKFVLRDGFPYGSQEDFDGPTDYEGQISNIFKVDGNDLILYYSGIKKEDLPPLTLDRASRRSEINRLNPQKWMVRDEQNKFSKPKLASSKYRIVRVDSQNRIWAMQNVNQLEEEPEVVTVYQLKLTKK